MIGFLSFISKINWTALPCLFLLFHSGVVEWSFLGDTGIVYSRKVTSLKLRRFHKPASHISQVYISRVSHKLSKASIFRLELSLWVTPQTERVIVLSKILALSNSLALLLAVISCQHGNNNRTIPVNEWLSQQLCQSQGSFSTRASAILEYDAYDVLLKCVLLANWVKDVVGHSKLWSEVMAWFTKMMCYNVYIPLLIMPDMSRNAG